MFASRLTLSLAASSLVSLACAPTRTTRAADLAEPRPTLVTVQNDNWLDVTVYAVRGSERVRLGMVTGSSSATFPLPRNLGVDGTVRLLADPVGSPRTYLTDVIDVGAGQRIRLQIGSVLTMSSFAVWNR